MNIVMWNQAHVVAIIYCIIYIRGMLHKNSLWLTRRATCVDDHRKVGRRQHIQDLMLVTHVGRVWLQLRPKDPIHIDDSCFRIGKEIVSELKNIHSLLLCTLREEQI